MKVTIENLEGRLRLRWTCPETGKRKNLALGVDDSTTGRAFASTIKDRIENDVRHGYYDASLLKYRPLTIGKNASEITTVELFDRFTKHQFKSEGLAQSSIESRYKPVKRMLEKHLNIQAANVDKRRAVSFADVCGDTLTPGTAKARIMLLKSAWEWGRGRYPLADENPWAGIAKRFTSIPVQPVAAFTKDEAKKIIEGFRNNRYYSHYADFVAFRLGMGTRGGEASALKWKHISADFRSIWIGESYSRGHTGSTKTKRARTVVMSDEAIMAPELDRDFALQTLCAYPNIIHILDASVLRDSDVSVLKGILDRNSPDLWDELTEELGTVKKLEYNPRLYAMFSLHRYRREFIAKQPDDVESQIAFYQWSAARTFRMFSDHVGMGGKYKIVDGVVHISSSFHRYSINFLSYYQSMLPVPLKYLPSNKFTYKNRHKIQDSINKSLGLKTPLKYPIKLKDEKVKDFEKRQKAYQTELNKESLAYVNLFSRFTASGEIYSYLNAEDRSETVKIIKEENRFLKASEDYENRRRQEIRPGKKSKPNIEIINDLLGWDESILSQSQINDLQEWNPDKLVLLQCQFCYRYEIAEPKNTRPAWHCGRPVCESAYRKWVDRLKSKGIRLKDLWVI